MNPIPPGNEIRLTYDFGTGLPEAPDDTGTWTLWYMDVEPRLRLIASDDIHDGCAVFLWVRGPSKSGAVNPGEPVPLRYSYVVKGRGRVLIVKSCDLPKGFDCGDRINIAGFVGAVTSIEGTSQGGLVGVVLKVDE